VLWATTDVTAVGSAIIIANMIATIARIPRHFPKFLIIPIPAGAIPAIH
jgi:F0F1-type ATP synthase membrane subunit c/vacuolar-type H+-ATPase subunit K